MPSKRSTLLKKAASPSSVERVCSEAQLPELAAELLSRAGASAWIFLEGELGAGKSALAQAVLRALGHPNGGEGSPTFPLAHEYRLSGRRVAHLDLYRIRSEGELEMTGLLEHFSGEPGVVLVEWGSLFAELFARLREQAASMGVSVIDVQIELAGDPQSGPDGGDERRRFRISSSTAPALRGTGSRRRSERG